MRSTHGDNDEDERLPSDQLQLEDHSEPASVKAWPYEESAEAGEKRPGRIGAVRYCEISMDTPLTLVGDRKEF